MENKQTKKEKKKKKEICPLLVQQPETSETNKVLFWTTELGPVYPAPFADLCDTQAVDFGLVCFVRYTSIKIYWKYLQGKLW